MTKPLKHKPDSAPPPLVYADFHRHTCIEVAREEGTVQFIPFNADTGFAVEELEARAFDKKFKPIQDYPVDRAAQLYLAYAANLGITRDTLKKLSAYAQLKEGDFVMATTKKEAPVKVPAKKSVKDPEPLVPKGKKATPPPTKAAEPKAEPKAAVKKEGKKPSAAQRFKDLIMEGKLTDKQIFLKVQSEFNLDDSKSGYVAWYRNWLKKNTDGPVPEQKKEK